MNSHNSHNSYNSYNNYNSYNSYNKHNSYSTSNNYNSHNTSNTRARVPASQHAPRIDSFPHPPTPAHPSLESLIETVDTFIAEQTAFYSSSRPTYTRASSSRGTMFVDVDEQGGMSVSWRYPERQREKGTPSSSATYHAPSPQPLQEEEVEEEQGALYAMHVPGPDGLLAPPYIRGADGAVFKRVSVNRHGRGVYVQSVTGSGEGVTRSTTSEARSQTNSHNVPARSRARRQNRHVQTHIKEPRSRRTSGLAPEFYRDGDNEVSQDGSWTPRAMRRFEDGEGEEHVGGLRNEKGGIVARIRGWIGWFGGWGEKERRRRRRGRG